jgi:hypothetical protein
MSNLPPQSKLGPPVSRYEQQFREGIALAVQTFNVEMLRGWLSEIEEIAICAFGTDIRKEHLSHHAVAYLEKKRRPWRQVDPMKTERATLQKAHSQMMQYIKNYITDKQVPIFNKTTEAKQWQFMQVLTTYGYYKKNLSGQKGDAFVCMLLTDNTWDVYRTLGLVMNEPPTSIDPLYITVLKKLAGPTTRGYLTEIYYNSHEDDADTVEGDLSEEEEEGKMSKRGRSDGLYCLTCHKQTIPLPPS